MARPRNATTYSLGAATISPRKRENGHTVWRVVWSADGRQTERTFESQTKAEAFAVQLWLQADNYDRGDMAFAADTPFFVVMGAWLDPKGHAGWRSQNTYNKHRAASKHLLPILGRYKCVELTEEILNDALQKSADKGLKDSTVKTHLDALRAVIRWGQSKGCWSAWDTLAENIGMPKKMTAPAISETLTATEVPTAEQVESLAKCLDVIHPEAGLMARLAASSGLRWGELIGLRPGDIDTVRRRIKVRRQIREISGVMEEDILPKHEKPRETIYSSAIARDMEILVARTKPGHYLFTTFSEGKLWRRSNFARRYMSPAKHAEGCVWPNHLTWHALRHFFCVDMLGRPGVKPEHVTRMAGHHSVRFTLDRYVRAQDDFLDIAAAAS